jgi:hypothetical protein
MVADSGIVNAATVQYVLEAMVQTSTPQMIEEASNLLQLLTSRKQWVAALLDTGMMAVVAKARASAEYIKHESVMVVLTECITNMIDDIPTAELVDSSGGLVGSIGCLREHTSYREHAWATLQLMVNFKELGCVSFNLHATGIPSIVVFLAAQDIGECEELAIECCKVCRLLIASMVY